MQRALRMNDSQLLCLAEKAMQDNCLRGFLQKRTSDQNRWQLRWFVLYQNLLFYYESEQCARPSGLIFLEGSYCERLFTPSTGSKNTTGNTSYIFQISYRKENSRMYELKAETEQECNSWLQAIDAASFSKMVLQKEELEQKHLHLVQIVESEKTAKWQYTQQCEELTVEIKKLRTELCTLKKEWRLTPSRPMLLASDGTSTLPTSEESEEIKKIKKVQSFFRGWLCRRRWKQIVAEYISSPHAENMRKRNSLVFRMVESEEDYVERLQLLVSCFLRPFKMAASSQKPPCTHDEVSSIFLNSETLMFLHQIFLKGLTARMESWPTLVLGDLFDMLLPMLSIYQEYVRNHHFSLQVLAECKQRDKFANILQRLEEKTVLQGRTLETFLTYPMHQVPRYIITLHELLAHTPHNHVERRSLENARAKLEELSRQMHDEVSETENIRKNLAIERMIIGGCDILLDVNQVFIRQGNVIQAAAVDKSRRARIVSKGSDQVRQCYLFTNHMLLCNRTSAGKLHLIEGIGKIPLADATLIEDPNEQFQFMIDDGEGSICSSMSNCDSQLNLNQNNQASSNGQEKDYGGLDFKIIVDFKTGPPITIHLVAPTMQEKAAWTSDISQCIDNVHFNDLFHGTLSDASSITMPHSIRNDSRLFKDDVDIRFSRTLNSCKLPQIRYASPERLFERLTDLRFLSIDFLNTFLLTYRVFTDGVKVLEALKKVHYQPELQNNDDAAGLLGEGPPHGVMPGSGDPDIHMRLASMLVVDYDYSRRVSSASMNSECGGDSNMAAGPGGHDMHRGSTVSASDLIANTSKITTTHTAAATPGSTEWLYTKGQSHWRLSHRRLEEGDSPSKRRMADTLADKPIDEAGEENASTSKDIQACGMDHHLDQQHGQRQQGNSRRSSTVPSSERENLHAPIAVSESLSDTASIVEQSTPTADGDANGRNCIVIRNADDVDESSNNQIGQGLTHAGVTLMAGSISAAGTTVASGSQAPANVSGLTNGSQTASSVHATPSRVARVINPVTCSQSSPNVMSYLRVRGAQGKRGSYDTESSSTSQTPRGSFQTESAIMLLTPRTSLAFSENPTLSSRAGVIVSCARSSARRSSTASAAAAFAAATAGSSNPPEPSPPQGPTVNMSQPPSRVGSRLPSQVGGDLKIPNLGPNATKEQLNAYMLHAKRESMISTAATMRVLNVLRHWVSKHSQDFENDERLHQMTTEFLDELVHNMSLLPAEHKAAAQLLQMMNNTKKDENQADVDLDILLAPHMTPSKENVESLSALEIAEGMTYLDHKIFINIRSEEFLGQAWMKPEKATKAGHILLMTRRFNDVSRLVVSEIMRCPEMSKRVAIIEKWAAVADICRCLHNLNGVLQICAAFMNSSVFRLKKTWERVSKTTKQTIDKLQTLVSADGRFRNMRDALHRCDPPCIPYLGMYLTDLSFIEEGTPNFTDEGLLNFSKMRMIAHVIREIRHFQQTPYKIEQIPKVFNYLLDPGRLMPDEELYRLSLCLEPRLSRLGTKLPTTSQPSSTQNTQFTTTTTTTYTSSLSPTHHHSH
ncbi:ras-specific guanine nucleotide-releasing factor 2-like isoform X2 [Varroa destructor]|uniref:Ras-specific guanine nucleotide-releasing factor 1 n=1 Tax=Varroa destructor TaxID=109461 RepID=A0A7M7KXD9_VARDE|nr:ras-specific guanine nucleotide-releasing factor 2-like isoform X2 [Varroa destructor]